MRDMLSTLNESLRLLDSAKQQAEQIEKVAKDRLEKVPEDLSKALEDYKKRIDTMTGDLVVADEDGIRSSAKLTDQVGGLYYAVSGGNAAPTSAMFEQFEFLKTRMPTKINEINRFITNETTQLNQVLQKNGLPIIVTGKTFEVPK